MKVLEGAGAALRWVLHTAVTLLVALLLVRTLVEYVPAFEALPLVRKLVAWWDPHLQGVVHGVGLPWSHDVRGLLFPGVAVALIMLRTVVQDAVGRMLRPKRAAPQPAAAPAPVPEPAAAMDPGATSLIPNAAPGQPVRSTTGTGFMPALPKEAPLPPSAKAASSALHIGRYEILGELGHGAMGVVYKALDPKIGRTVAIKTISAAGTGSDLEQYRARFLVEAKSAGRLNHPGIVAVHDVTDDEAGRPCIVLEFVDGTTLDRLNPDGAMPLQQALDIIAQVARALAYAHQHGIIHRDIKPANIMVTASGQAKLSDFGIAKLEGTTMTIAGQVMGTPAYMSPEQCTGETLDPRSDIFSLGSVLYTVCVGQKPFPGDTFTSVAYKVAHTDPPAPRTVNPALPDELDRIIARAMAKDPAARYANGNELAADLEALRAVLPRVGEKTSEIRVI